MKATALLAILLALGTVGCTERDQSLYQGKVQNGEPAYKGTGVAVFTAPGWTPGDRNSWEQELKVRTQRQNEYNRMP